MRLSLIAAVADNRVIGRDGGLPWHLPADLRRFKKLTTGHALIMGRRTYESLGRPLPRRRLIVLSRDPGFRSEGIETAPGLDAALALAQDDDEVFIGGGAGLYRRALGTADRLYLTAVHARPAGDVFFPEWDESAFRLVEEEPHPADERHAHAFTFRTYDRRRPSGPGR